MTELEKIKSHAVDDLKHLCAKCKNGIDHVCPVNAVIREIENLNGIPVIVNSRLYHVVFN